MAISRQKKEEIVRDLEDKFSRHKAAVFVDYSGLGVGNIENIRGELRKEGIDMKIAKKTLLDLVMRKLKIGVDIHSLSGQIAVVFGYKDEVMPAKIINKFTKEKEFKALKILGGIMHSEFIVSERVVELANIPSREELLGKMMRGMQAPMSGFINVIRGNMRGLVQVLNAISNKS